MRSKKEVQMLLWQMRKKHLQLKPNTFEWIYEAGRIDVLEEILSDPQLTTDNVLVSDGPLPGHVCIRREA
jgi:hypothetical protein